MKDQISALMDDEFDVEGSGHLLTAIKAGGELAESWSTYHLIGDAMRGEAFLQSDLKLGGEDGIEVIGLAKERELEAGSAPDRIYRRNVKDSIPLRANSPELYVLARIRDEARRRRGQGLLDRGEIRDALAERAGDATRDEDVLRHRSACTSRVARASGWATSCASNSRSRSPDWREPGDHAHACPGSGALGIIRIELGESLLSAAEVIALVAATAIAMIWVIRLNRRGASRRRNIRPRICHRPVPRQRLWRRRVMRRVIVGVLLAAAALAGPQASPIPTTPSSVSTTSMP